MFGFDEAKENYDQLQSGNHEAKFSHELLAGGASFAAFKAFENNQRSNGEPVTHGVAKAILAGLVGAEVDRLAETKGANWIDKERATRDAQKRTEDLYDSHYGKQDDWRKTHDPPEHFPNRNENRNDDRYDDRNERRNDDGYDNRNERRNDDGYDNRNENRNENRYDDRNENRNENRYDDRNDNRDY
ncbi:CipC-like antibiotic response protein, putative [Cordyceps militaris CM01]|uniref:CipC-like antibiotic response protein, putative n=1 Tax=Cordyceps militaris (strain CM01) TaxID=983644 RepID=G3JRZ3_CORMM|nr:CipC-like antibiotic response protein, putative [Cordyceps militaris CM01]EGX88639.1 CipC-like antibiotic response protein, putative [Cordyceps militaris CM01]